MFMLVRAAGCLTDMHALIRIVFVHADMKRT